MTYLLTSEDRRKLEEAMQAAKFAISMYGPESERAQFDAALALLADLVPVQEDAKREFVIPTPLALVHVAHMAQDWIGRAPHGDNCFVSNHYEGDPGDRCNCGKDSVELAIEVVLERPDLPREPVDAAMKEHPQP